MRDWPTIVILDSEMKFRDRGHSGDEAMRIARALVARMERGDQVDPRHSLGAHPLIVLGHSKLGPEHRVAGVTPG